jgi:hypothetical protein
MTKERGRPGKPTEKEKVFAEVLATSGDRVLAAKAAGYTYPHQSGYVLAQNPRVQAEVVKIQADRINNDLLPLAVNCLEELLIDKKAPAGARVQAAKLVFDRALGDTAAADKAAHELTGDELARQIDRLRLEVAKRTGQVIEGELTEHTRQTGVFD